MTSQKSGSSFKSCGVCGSSQVTSITTYKHKWHVCRDCGCASSQVRRFPPLNFLPVAQLKVRKSVIANPETMYDYADSPPEKFQADEEMAQLLADEWMNGCHIPLAGKKFIEISGGTGAFVRTLTRFGAEVFHTEYDSKAVEFVKSTGIESFRFDFNADRLRDVTSRVFDIILLKGALEFCTDMSWFLAGAAPNVKPGTIVIVITCVPTLGNFLYTQFDDYNQPVLYQPEILIRRFAEHGYALRRRRDLGDTRNRGPLTLYRSKKAVPLMLWYMVPALFKMPPDKRFLFHALDVRAVHLIFEKGL
jgi:2-polyprenyl-3-methyl-5-hydroxy-6-metoxy-1,4-benzoquinol methylase